MLYLASPYSDSDPKVRQQRFDAVRAAAAKLILSGLTVVAPTLQGHLLVPHGLATDLEFWAPHNRILLSRCDELVVLALDGWQESAGVQAEIRWALEMGKTVRCLPPQDATVSPTLAPFAAEVES